MSKNIQVRLYVKFIVKVFIFRVPRFITQVNNDIGRGSSVVRVSSRYGLCTVIVFTHVIANGEITGHPATLWPIYPSPMNPVWQLPTCKRNPHATYTSYLPDLYSNPAVWDCLPALQSSGPLLAIFSQAATYEWHTRLKTWCTHWDRIYNCSYIFFRIYRGGYGSMAWWVAWPSHWPSTVYPNRKGPSQLTRGNDPSFPRLKECSPGSTLFLHTNLPSDPTLLPMVLCYQLTIAQPSWGQHWCSRVNSKQSFQWVWKRRAISPCQLTWTLPFWV